MRKLEHVSVDLTPAQKLAVKDLATKSKMTVATYLRAVITTAIQPSEFYPSDEDFGSKAWSLPNLAEAHKKLEKVRNHRPTANADAVCAIHV